VSFCVHFFVAAVPQLFLHMRLCRIENTSLRLCAALPQNEDKIKVHLGTFVHAALPLKNTSLDLYQTASFFCLCFAAEPQR
jgi:hypothetical protein